MPEQSEDEPLGDGQSDLVHADQEVREQSGIEPLGDGQSDADRADGEMPVEQVSGVLTEPKNARPLFPPGRHLQQPRTQKRTATFLWGCKIPTPSFGILSVGDWLLTKRRLEHLV